VHGHLVPLDYPPLSPEQTKALAYSLISSEQRERFEKSHELDFSYGITGVARYRVNVYQQRSSVGVAIRAIPYTPKGFEELGLPVDIFNTLIQKHKGLILVTGPTGQGKTTTMAAMIDRINRLRDVHIMTVEDPVEYLFKHQKALVNQREVGDDTHSFPAALKYVLRQDPDVVLIGEMRDLETIQAALTIAETGHLTIATLHTNSCAQSIDRIIDVFPPHQQSQVRAQLALVLEAVFNQLLVPRRDGKGRSLAMEILVATPAIRNLIREEKVHQVYSAIQAGQKFGMKTMNQALAELVQRGVINRQDALDRSGIPEELIRLLDQSLSQAAAR
ncbi:MAG: type IV pilus twitching motility protein PilT, partial [Candidatus Rokubacteria bacterium]|nr:type IV pilus twitching motility protein PilT [Candidatus Rokubacteria bacterium]